jgi:RNA polymerase-binding transcription factor DksA
VIAVEEIQADACPNCGRAIATQRLFVRPSVAYADDSDLCRRCQEDLALMGFLVGAAAAWVIFGFPHPSSR